MLLMRAAIDRACSGVSTWLTSSTIQAGGE